MSGFVHETSVVKNSQLGEVKLFRNAVVSDSKMGNGCSIGDDSTIERCTFENNVLINRRSFVNDSFIGCFSYAGINTTINWTKLGRFCSLARNVDIGGFDHDYHKITTMPEFRFKQMIAGGGKIPVAETHKDYCVIGNDVWIAAGAQVLHKVKIGDGAVVGGGAVVTHDVPPYAIVVGIPAKIIGFRCEKDLIDKLIELKWWNWSIDVIVANKDIFINSNISKESIEKMQDIYNSQVKK